MRFARHLASALLVVAVIVALGVAWEHSSAAGWVGGRTGHAAARATLLKGSHPGRLTVGGRIIAAPLRIRPGAALRLSDTGDLIRTVMIEAALIAVVVAIDAARRRRRARRARQA